MRFFTSDTHAGHEKNLDYSARDFPSIAAHDDALVSNWNAVVSTEDEVHHLGDVTFMSTEDTKAWLARLNGTMLLTPGNHDFYRNKTRGTDVPLAKWYEPRVPVGSILTLDGGLEAELVHKPTHAKGHTGLVLCGRVHNAWKFYKHEGGRLWDSRVDVPPCLFVNVGIDHWGYAPVSEMDLVRAVLLHR